jgi:hypothetical protein
MELDQDHSIHISDTIDLHQDPDIIYWTRKWKVSEADLWTAYRKAESSDSGKIYQALQELGLIKAEQ